MALTDKERQTVNLIKKNVKQVMTICDEFEKGLFSSEEFEKRITKCGMEDPGK